MSQLFKKVELLPGELGCSIVSPGMAQAKEGKMTEKDLSPLVPPPVTNVLNTLRVAPASDAAERSLRFRVVAADDSIVLQVYDVTETCVSPDQSLVCLLVMDAYDAPVLKVSHRKGIASVTICSPTGVLIGESISELRIRCCSIKPKYTLLSRFGKQLLVLEGKARCCPPGLQVRVRTGGVAGREIASISMPTISSFSAEVKFLPEEKVSDHSRNLILGMAIGIILQSQDARHKHQSQDSTQKRQSEEPNPINGRLSHDPNPMNKLGGNLRRF